MNSKSGSVSKYDSNTGNIWIRHSYDIICEKIQKERNDAERRKDFALKALGFSTEKGTACEKEEAQNTFDSAMSYFQSMKKRYKNIFSNKFQEKSC